MFVIKPFVDEILPSKLNFYRTLTQNTPEWETARKDFFLGASETGAAMGIDKHTSRMGLWKRKMGYAIPRDDPLREEILQWGRDHESDAAEEFQTIFSDRDCEIYTTGIWPYMDDLRLGGSPDRIVKMKKKKPCLLEIKCPHSKKIPEEIPPYHLTQMVSLMKYCDMPLCYYYVWTPNASCVWKVKKNDRMFNELIYPLCREFMDEYILSDKCPPRMPPGRKQILKDEIMSYHYNNK